MAKRIIISFFSLFGVMVFTFMILNYFNTGNADFSIRYFLDNIPDFDLLKYIRVTLDEIQVIISDIKAVFSDGFDFTDIAKTVGYIFIFQLGIIKLVFVDILQTLLDMFLWVFKVIELAGSGPMFETPFDNGYLV